MQTFAFLKVKNYSSNNEHVFLLKKRDYNETIESAFKNIVMPMLKETGDNFINYFNNWLNKFRYS